jgi:phage tail sheath protein FI
MDYTTPGVFVEEIPLLPPSVAPVATAIPAFIGYTAEATDRADGDLNMRAKRISSYTDFLRFFGPPDNEAGLTVVFDANDRATVTAPNEPVYFLPYVVRHYFDNGGGPCYIVSVGQSGAIAIGDATTGLTAGLGVIRAEDEPTLLVFPDLAHTSVGDTAAYAFYSIALQQCADLGDRFLIADILAGTDPDIDNDVVNGAAGFRSGIGTNNLKYGAAYYPFLQTLYNLQYDPADVDVTLPSGGGAVGLDTLEDGDNNNYFHLAKQAIAAELLTLPPCGAIAGVYAAVDRVRGVWKAPANVSLRAVMAPSVVIDHETNGRLNVDGTGKSVNAIRTFTGKGHLVWGARTLAGNDNEWRYIPVRRFFNFAEESIVEATEQFVFEPNDANTWTKVRAMIENFLTLQWRAGALAGAKPEDAFFVKVGLGTTMTPLDILEGRMNVEIGMAVVRPAEFIILKFSHKMQES